MADGYYKILSSHSGKAVSIQDSNVAQNTYTGTDSQLWKFVSTGNSGVYYIISKDSEHRLSIDTNAPCNGTNVAVNVANTAIQMRWKLNPWTE